MLTSLGSRLVRPHHCDHTCLCFLPPFDINHEVSISNPPLATIDAILSVSSASRPLKPVSTLSREISQRPGCGCPVFCSCRSLGLISLWDLFTSSTLRQLPTRPDCNGRETRMGAVDEAFPSSRQSLHVPDSASRG